MSHTVYKLGFNVILCLNIISLCFKLIIIHNHTPKQNEIRIKPRILNHNIYIAIRFPTTESVFLTVFYIRQNIGKGNFFNITYYPCIRSAVKSMANLAKPGQARLAKVLAGLARKAWPGKAGKPGSRPGF